MMRQSLRVADHQVLAESLTSPAIGDTVDFGGLTLVPLLHPNWPEPDWALPGDQTAVTRLGGVRVIEARTGTKR
jgi:hypothetical protein